jgi:plastocyanin
MVNTHKRTWRTIAPAVVLCAATAIALFAVRTPAGAADQAVSINALAFSPTSVSINVGDTVTWTNNEVGVQHTVTSDSGAELSSGLLSTGQTYAHQFNTAGTFPYHCNVHPTMAGTVVVQQQTGETPTNTPTNTATATATATPTVTGTVTNTPTATATLTATLTPTSTPTLIPATSTATPTATSTGVTSPASPTPGPPATGQGGASGGADGNVIAITLLAMAVIAAAGGALALRGTPRR